MRVVVGSEASRDFADGALDRHLETLSRFAEQASRADGSLRCTMILRSAASVPAKALVASKDVLLAAGVRVQAVIAKLDPACDLEELFATLSALSPHAAAGELIRWVRNPRLLEAHEQVTYGDAMCWTGDAMRRDAERRNTLVLFDTDDAEAALFGRRAFLSLWTASETVPASYLAAGGEAKPGGSCAPSKAPVTVLKRPPQGWPLLRH